MPSLSSHSTAAPAAAAALLAAALLALTGLSPAAHSAEAARLAHVANFNSPIYATSAPGDGRRLFVVERGGTIRVLVDGRKLQKPFLRIPGGVSTDGERGLLSMAFAPGYRQNRRLYVFYTTPGGDLRVDEFRRTARSPNRARRDSRRRVIQIEHSARANHNGGQLQFGPDGRLYISTGDGGGAGDPNRNGQNIRSLLGKILRIDPRPRAGRPYTSPQGNPFVGRGGRDEIFALGLRNPFRFSFDRRSGALAIGDVGQRRFEEVNYRLRTQRPGANFGWNCFEGRNRYEGAPAGCELSFGRHVRPVLQRSHTAGDCSVIGGYVARHRSLGPLRGRYVYGDFCTGVLRSARLRVDGAVGNRRVPGAELPPGSLVSFGEGAGGRMYVVSRSGPVYQLRG